MRNVEVLLQKIVMFMLERKIQAHKEDSPQNWTTLAMQTGKKERASFVTCGRCKVPLYCSRGCQVADWPDHENDCDTCVAARKRQMAQAAEINT